jgi:hypothetical protein
MAAKTAPRFWLQILGANTFRQDILLPGRVVAGGGPLACHCFVMVMSPKPSSRSSRPKLLSPFIGNFSFICSRTSGAGRTTRRVTFRSFAQQLAVLLSAKAAFQAIILAFYRNNTYVCRDRVTAERIGLAANSAPD